MDFSEIYERYASDVHHFALYLSGLAFGRIVSDTSFDVSPRKFIGTAVVAACFWVAFLVRLFRGRREVLLRIRR